MGGSTRDAEGAGEIGGESGGIDADAAGDGSDPTSFEAALARLEATVARLEEGEMPLEKALELFETGVRLSRQCTTTLEAAERRIEILVADRDGDADAAEPFEPDEAWDADEEADDEDVED